MSMLPFLVPGTVFAMGFRLHLLSVDLAELFWGYYCPSDLLLPYAVTLMQDGTRAIGVKLEEQARVLGAGALQAF